MSNQIAASIVRQNSTSISSLSKKFIDADDKDSSDVVSPTSSTLQATLRRYQKPLAVSLFALAFVLVMTLSVLYWNYYETVTRRSTKKQSVILDHWGKGSSSSSSVDPDSDQLRETLTAKERTKIVTLDVEKIEADDDDVVAPQKTW